MASVTERGLLAPDGLITDDGREALAIAEQITDRLAQEPWDLVGRDVAARFAEVAEPLALAARAELPDVTPLGLPKAEETPT